MDMREIQVAAEGKKDPFIEAQKAFNMFDTDGSGICESCKGELDIADSVRVVAMVNDADQRHIQH